MNDSRKNRRFAVFLATPVLLLAGVLLGFPIFAGEAVPKNAKTSNLSREDFLPVDPGVSRAKVREALDRLVARLPGPDDPGVPPRQPPAGRELDPDEGIALAKRTGKTLVVVRRVTPAERERRRAEAIRNGNVFAVADDDDDRFAEGGTDLVFMRRAPSTGAPPSEPKADKAVRPAGKSTSSISRQPKQAFSPPVREIVVEERVFAPPVFMPPAVIETPAIPVSAGPVPVSSVSGPVFLPPVIRPGGRGPADDNGPRPPAAFAVMPRIPEDPVVFPGVAAPVFVPPPPRLPPASVPATKAISGAIPGGSPFSSPVNTVRNAPRIVRDEPFVPAPRNFPVPANPPARSFTGSPSCPT